MEKSSEFFRILQTAYRKITFIAKELVVYKISLYVINTD
jgi:hypothetical protein